MPVILTLGFLANITKDSFLYLVGAKIEGFVETDIDLIALCDRKIIFCECKDFECGPGSKGLQDIKQQTGILYDLAKKMDVCVLLISSLINEDGVSYFEELQRMYLPTDNLNVFFLHADDLEKGKKEKIYFIDNILPTKSPSTKINYLIFGKETGTVRINL